jgi:hypothetical protein
MLNAGNREIGVLSYTVINTKGWPEEGSQLKFCGINQSFVYNNKKLEIT